MNQFAPMNFLTNAVKYMIPGMLAIFAVIGAIIIATVILNKVTSKKK